MLSVFRPETRVAIEAVTRALALVRSGVGAHQVTAKSGRDLVTADEDAVRSLVAAALGFAVIGEERGGQAPVDGAP